MHTNKPQLRLLPVIICFAAILLLASACRGDGENSSTKEETEFMEMSCKHEIEQKIEEMRLMPTPIGLEYQSEEYRKNWKRNRAKMAVVMPVFEKHREKFWRQPNIWGSGPGSLLDENGEETEEFGITIYVTKKVPQDQLPPEDRIPDRIGCVRIQIIEKPNNAILWSHSFLVHRPAMAGVLVASPSPSGGDPSIGTLTGLAVRNSDGKKVLVTNLHVLTGGYGRAPTGSEELYQPETTSPAYKVARILHSVEIVPGQDNIADVAISELLPGVDASYDPHNSNHDMGFVASGTVEPEEGMYLTFLGAVTRGRVARVKELNQERTVGGVRFVGVTTLDLSQNPGGGGDSGAACLHQTGHDRYQMSCILFGGSDDGREGYAFPASVAERELGITFGNDLPVASASASPSTASPGATVTLDGSGSTDPEGDTLSYSWKQRAGSSVTLSSATVASPTFTAPLSATTLTFRLTVTDSHGLSDTDTVDIVVNRAPTANAGSNQTVDTEATVTLDGSGSSDPDGDTLSYSWEKQAGPSVALSSAAVSNPTFTAPPSATTFTFKLTVTDSYGASDTDTVTIRVREPETWGSWRDTGKRRGSGQSREKEQSRTSSRGNRRTRWVADPESETWGSWSRTGRTRGSAQNREAEESRTSSYGNRRTRWVADPEPETWGSWSRTGRTRGSAQNREAEESRTSSYGSRRTRWVSDPEPETWGSWSRTGRTRGSAQNREAEESRTSSYGNRRTRWVSDPEPETWGSWSRTGRTRGSAGYREAEESRTSSYGNRRTRWVADPEPEPETWGLWSDTGRTRGNEEEGFEKEQQRTSNYGNTQIRWVVDWTFGG